MPITAPSSVDVCPVILADASKRKKKRYAIDGT